MAADGDHRGNLAMVVADGCESCRGIVNRIGKPPKGFQFGVSGTVTAVPGFA
jgi:hypothetical protein